MVAAQNIASDTGVSKIRQQVQAAITSDRRRAALCNTVRGCQECAAPELSQQPAQGITSRQCYLGQRHMVYWRQEAQRTKTQRILQAEQHTGDIPSVLSIHVQRSSLCSKPLHDVSVLHPVHVWAASHSAWHLHLAETSNVISVAYGMQEIVSANGASEEALDVSSSVDTRAAPQDLQEAATIISEHVQQLIPRVCHHLAADDR